MECERTVTDDGLFKYNILLVVVLMNLVGNRVELIPPDGEPLYKCTCVDDSTNEYLRI